MGPSKILKATTNYVANDKKLKRIKYFRLEMKARSTNTPQTNLNVHGSNMMVMIDYVNCGSHK
jgi:hypothetical protein